jgi:hypothetical protein
MRTPNLVDKGPYTPWAHEQAGWGCPDERFLEFPIGQRLRLDPEICESRAGCTGTHTCQSYFRLTSSAQFLKRIIGHIEDCQTHLTSSPFLFPPRGGSCLAWIRERVGHLSFREVTGSMQEVMMQSTESDSEDGGLPPRPVAATVPFARLSV